MNNPMWRRWGDGQTLAVLCLVFLPTQPGLNKRVELCSFQLAVCGMELWSASIQTSTLVADDSRPFPVNVSGLAVDIAGVGHHGEDPDLAKRRDNQVWCCCLLVRLDQTDNGRCKRHARERVLLPRSRPPAGPRLPR